MSLFLISEFHSEATMNTKIVEITTDLEGKNSIVNFDSSLTQHSIVLISSKISLFKTFPIRDEPQSLESYPAFLTK